MGHSVVVLFALLASAVSCVLTRSRLSAWLLLVCAALWLPANHHHFEGPTLIGLARHHGVTAGDLLTVGGFLLAAGTLVMRTEPGPRRRSTQRNLLATSVSIVLVGAVWAWLAA